jgi:hypothetical protein
MRIAFCLLAVLLVCGVFLAKLRATPAGPGPGNHGIVPKFSVELSRDALREGRDTQLETAVQVAQAI